MIKKPDIRKNSMNYGAILGVTLIALTLLLYLVNRSFSKSFNWVEYLIIISVITIGTKSLRDKEMGGAISFTQALGSGILISFFGSIFVAFFTYVLYVIIDPGLLEELFEFNEELMQEQGKFSEEKIEYRMNIMRETITPLRLSLFVIPVYTFVGFLLSLLVSIFLKKEKNPFSKTENQI
ncbi:DUF4199 domain-containing protein [Bacteroidota bacterium]